MKELKEILKTTLIVLLNIGLVLLPFILYDAYTDKMVKTTSDGRGDLIPAVFIVVIIIGIALFFLKKKMRPYLIGFISISIYCIIFFIFYVNKNCSAPGKFETFKLRNPDWIPTGFKLNIDFNGWYNSTEVTLDKYLDVDSVQVRVDKGFFGMRTMSNEVRIVESLNCETKELDSTNLIRSLLEYGDDLSFKRCFHPAIDVFSKYLELDSFNIEAYGSRGLMYMAIKKYDKALSDFYSVCLLEQELDKPKADRHLNIVEFRRSITEFLSKFSSKDFFETDKLFKEINKSEDIGIIGDRITFCIEKIREGK